MLINGQMMLMRWRGSRMDMNQKGSGSESAMTTINHLIMNMHNLSSNISHSTACFCVIYLPHFHLLFVILSVHLQKLLMSPTGSLILLPVHKSVLLFLMLLEVQHSWQLHKKTLRRHFTLVCINAMRHKQLLGSRYYDRDKCYSLVQFSVDQQKNNANQNCKQL